MLSHTIPQKLLEQFAYRDTRTGLLRLWRYERNRRPYSKASPSKATAKNQHFFDPADPQKEEQLEARLNQEFEDPVNRFLSEIGDSAFVLTDERRRRLTFYVTLLFFRSEARRRASSHLQRVTQKTVEQFLSNESQVQTVAAKWSIDLLLSGRMKQGLVTREEVVALVRTHLNDYPTEAHAQSSYVGTVERMMTELDDKVYSGDWLIVSTNADNPFIISDAPVVTWERLGPELLSYGLGFHRANVEAFLPISPVVCLHILPNVERTRTITTPSVKEVNMAQAAFASRACYSNMESVEIDKLVQENFGKAELGVKSFTVWHRDYSTAVFDILMGRPDWLERTSVPSLK